jgi:uncharacterized protein (TIGR02145 family)
MGKLFIFIIVISFVVSINAQTVTGKLVDQNGKGLSGMQLKLYINPKVYNATSLSDGTFTFINITDIKETNLPTGYSVSENYPNPFNPRTRIDITMPNSGNVKVEIFNTLGQRVMQEINKQFGAGNNNIDLELNGLPNGIYFARMIVDNKYTVIKKMMLMYGSQHLNFSGGVKLRHMNESSIYNKAEELRKTNLSIIIDSLVVVGPAINKNRYKDFGSQPNSANLGNIIVNTTTAGLPCPGMETIIYEGKSYNTVQIGTQCWFKENLDVGTMIQGTQEQTNNGVMEKYCYNNEASSCATFGGLYQWAEAVQYKNGATNTLSPNPAFSGNVQGICPTGWHIPSKEDFETLSKSTLVNYNSNTLKAVGQGIGGGVGTNSTGFSGLLTGYRLTNGNFDYDILTSLYWSSSEASVSWVYYKPLVAHSNAGYLLYDMKKFGYSVRCLMD